MPSTLTIELTKKEVQRALVSAALLKHRDKVDTNMLQLIQVGFGDRQGHTGMYFDEFHAPGAYVVGKNDEEYWNSKGVDIRLVLTEQAAEDANALPGEGHS